MSQTFIKCVVVGDGAVGKTCLIHVFTQNCFPEDYIPTVFDNYQTNIDLDNRNFQLGIWDTAGQDDYDSVRPLSYSGAQVFLICYSIMAPANFDNVRQKWAPEIFAYKKDIPIILVGTKGDLLNDQEALDELKAQTKSVPVTTEQAAAMQKEIGAIGNVVISARTGKGVKELFENAVRAAITPINKKKGGCGTN
ncbi:Rac/Rho-like protein [Spironucleus salmonicida]|uniref:Rac/Rho-like protein n=1 Tax=Spironucleus salmonicida TaxID=348837 RepID=V6LUD7_9EUKA|nr:Rac/Rho-like protein [Spironucleus salmonicida]|eukprot:EST47321.1 Rac/Rho-like protein [Spironucleus salmonicida]